MSAPARGSGLLRSVRLLAALALLVTGLSVVVSVKTAPPARAANPVVCSVTNPLLVNQQSEGSDVQAKTNTLQYYDTQTGAISQQLVNLNNVTVQGNPGTPSGPVLPDTGGPSVWWVGGGFVSILAGVALVAGARRRRS